VLIGTAGFSTRVYGTLSINGLIFLNSIQATAPSILVHLHTTLTTGAINLATILTTGSINIGTSAPTINIGTTSITISSIKIGGSVFTTVHINGPINPN